MAQALAERDFDELITLILARFAACPGAEVAASIHTSLQEIADFLGVEYALVVRTTPDLSSWSVAHEWCAPEANSWKDQFQQVPMGSWDFNEKVLLAGKVLQLNSMEAVPEESAAVRQYMESLGFRSTLQVPTRRPGGQISGCVAVFSLTREIAWNDTDIQRMRLVADAIANAMERAEVEKELRRSEARFRATFERAPVGIVNVSREGMLIRANGRFCDMLGYTQDEIQGLHYADITHPDDIQATTVLYENVLANRSGNDSLEKRYLRKDGQVAWGNLTLSLLTDDDTDTAVFVAAIEDTSARKRAEETFDAVPDLIYVADCHQRVVRANRATARRLGVSREEVLGRSCHEIIRGASVGSGSLLHDGMSADGLPHQFETHEPHLGGDFLVSCTPLLDARGELAGTVHVARDVTELRRSERALRRAHEELIQRRALVVAASLDGVWEWEASTERVLYSDRFAELLGYDGAEVPPTLDFFRSILHPDDAQELWSAVDRHLTEGAPYDVECRLRTREGNYRWYRTRGRAQRDAQGESTWMAGSLQDIDQQKTAERDLRTALAEVERLTDRLRAENTYLQEEISDSLGFDAIVGKSEPIRSVLAQIEHVADTNASVLLLGETGTGKELLARAIHDRSQRRDRPLVKVNLAAFPSSLIESELFGHIKGAFTGAVADKVGRFQLADGGTLFLDEIGELDPELQTKLLRVLQEGDFERIGSSQTMRVDVRIVAATNRDLRRAMEDSRFRPDLYYRLAVFPIEIPPLRLRRDDIPLLVWHFIAKKQGRLGKTFDTVPPSVMETLIQYDWPGNVRELENVVERAMILSSGSALTLEESLRPVRSRVTRTRSAASRSVKRDQIIRVLKECHWKIKGVGNAAERLGLNPSTLRYRMKVLGIERPSR